MRIGLIHISNRLDTWGNYYAWELRRRDHEVVWCAEPVGPFPEFKWRDADCDIYIRIDDSQNFETPPIYHPLIYLASDAHVPDGVNRKKIAFEADHTFFCQKNAESLLYGAGEYEWMPHAAWFFPERAKEPHLDVCSFMVLGPDDHSLFGERSRLARRLASELDRSRVAIRKGPIHDNMATGYKNSRIVWHHSVGNDIAMRIFEGAACGACVVSNRIVDNGMADIFGDLIPQYETADECMDLIRSLLAKPAECEERGRELRTLVERMHRYRHRVDRVLGRAEELVS